MGMKYIIGFAQDSNRKEVPEQQPSFILGQVEEGRVFQRLLLPKTFLDQPPGQSLPQLNSEPKTPKPKP